MTILNHYTLRTEFDGGHWKAVLDGPDSRRVYGHGTTERAAISDAVRRWYA